MHWHPYCCISGSVEITHRVTQRPARDIAANLHTQVTVRHQCRRKSQLQEAVELIRLQSLEAHRSLEFARLYREPRRKASGDERIDND